MKLAQLLMFITYFFSQFSASFAGLNTQGFGVLYGKVTDKNSNETLIGVPILIEGLGLGTVSDLDGNYRIENIPEGKHSVVVSYIGYQKMVIPHISIATDKELVLNFMLEENQQVLKEVVIEASMKRENIGSVILMQKLSATVQDGISSESIKKSSDKNTGEVVRRISGASLQEGRFVVIRGLNERYNVATLNEFPLASTEPDRKAFSFDLIPSSLLDNIVIVKTASPDLPGDFAGGILQIATKDIPDMNFFSFQAGTGFNSFSTFKKYTTYEGGGTDWLGLDDGTRAVPSDFPETIDFKKSNQTQKIEYSKIYSNDWGTHEKESSPLSQSYQISSGKKFNINRGDAGIIGALSYSISNKKTEIRRADYDFDGSKKYNFEDSQYKENIFWGGLLNLSYEPEKDHSISIKNLFSVNSDDQVITRNGTDIENLQYIQASSLKYTSTGFLNSIISGKHIVSEKKVSLKWNAGLTNTFQSVPNLRRMYYYRNADINTEDTTLYAYVPFGNASPNYAGRFYSDLSEQTYNADINFEIPFQLGEKSQRIKIGGQKQYKERSFNARVLGYIVTNPGKFNWNLLLQPIDSIFNPSNIGMNGFRLDEITNPSDQYDASSDLSSAFVKFENSVSEKVKLIWGVRIENFNQRLNSFGYSNDTIDVNTEYADILPSLNAVYSLTQKSNIRFAVSKTTARPEFRELAPFSYYDFSTATTVEGNPDLKRTEIYNYDLRYEIFPSHSQIFTASLFYKEFVNPIEPYIESSGAGSRRVSYQNAESSFLYGIEFEWRKKLEFMDNLLSWAKWENMSVFGNVALIKSEVDKSNDLRDEDKRPMQGQSPYLINSGISYSSPKSGFEINILYNRIGKRIFQVGNSGYLSIDEAPRNLIDLQIGKRIFESGFIKLAINDLLNEPGLFYQDQNQNGRYAADVDNGISEHKNGVNYSLSVSYRF
ncbi:MAG: TonB-dependent receptor [Bacteroidetes bacterium]|nr:MAG: TonB-dependent receptor [Bacteroidota bacterium]REK50521.1 MAG: TonB-dependent receptor [Bacteroidota bacterium]